MANGVLFVATPGQKAIALNASTGVPLWTSDPWEGSSGAGNTSGFLYWRDGQEEPIYQTFFSTCHGQTGSQTGRLERFRHMDILRLLLEKRFVGIWSRIETLTKIEFDGGIGGFRAHV